MASSPASSPSSSSKQQTMMSCSSDTPKKQHYRAVLAFLLLLVVSASLACSHYVCRIVIVMMEPQQQEDWSDSISHSIIQSSIRETEPRLRRRRRQQQAPVESVPSSSTNATSTISNNNDDDDDNEEEKKGTFSLLWSQLWSWLPSFSVGWFFPNSILTSELTKQLLVTALVSLLYEACLGHILEHLKIVLQTTSGDDDYANLTYRRAIRNIVRQKGIQGLWDGFWPWGMLQALTKGAVFGVAYQAASSVLVPHANNHWLARTLAGGFAGGVQGYALSPLLLLKTRVMTTTHDDDDKVSNHTSAWCSTTRWRTVLGGDGGWRSVFRGAHVFAAKRVCDWSSRYCFANALEALFFYLMVASSTTTMQIPQTPQLSLAAQSTASLLGGVLSTLVTMPLDVLVAQLQAAAKQQQQPQAGGGAATPMVSSSSAWTLLFRGDGRHMRGFAARLLHVCFTTLVIKTGTPVAYHLLFGSSSE